jgi:LAO/AO transport system kinase
MAPTQSELRGIDELVETIEDHTNYLHESATLDQARAGRVEQELALVFKDEVEKSIFKGLKGTGKKRAYIRAILDGKTNPYEVVEEVLRAFLKVE